MLEAEKTLQKHIEFLTKTNPTGPEMVDYFTPDLPCEVKTFEDSGYWLGYIMSEREEINLLGIYDEEKAGMLIQEFEETGKIRVRNLCSMTYKTITPCGIFKLKCENAYIR